jgi:hypothetical protein
MTRSIIELPADTEEDFEVYVNGIRQHPDIDFQQDGRELIFDRALRRDHISGWRWLLGAWGVGTYRQDDTVDIRYEVDGEIRLKHAAPIMLEDE